jgi:hypothetical protein
LNSRSGPPTGAREAEEAPGTARPDVAAGAGAAAAAAGAVAFAVRSSAIPSLGSGLAVSPSHAGQSNPASSITSLTSERLGEDWETFKRHVSFATESSTEMMFSSLLTWRVIEFTHDSHVIPSTRKKYSIFFLIILHGYFFCLI